MYTDLELLKALFVIWSVPFVLFLLTIIYASGAREKVKKAYRDDIERLWQHVDRLDRVIATWDGE